MIPDTTTTQDMTINKALYLMADLSPRVRDSIDMELYRTTADSDESTDTYVLEDSFYALTQDTMACGFEFQFDYSHLVTDLEQLFKFLEVLTYLMPNSLHGLIRADSHIRHCLQSIIDGSLGEHETVIQTYLSELGGLDGQLPLRPDLTETLEQYYPYVTQTENFTDYIKNLLSLYDTQRLTIESDEDSHKAYRDTIRDLIGRMSDAVNKFQLDPSYDRLCQIQNLCIQDLVAPANFTNYAYLLTNSKESLPDDLQSGYEKKWYEYKVSHIWCHDYYTLRTLKAIGPEILMIYCFLYAITANADVFKAQCLNLKRFYAVPKAESAIFSLYHE